MTKYYFVSYIVQLDIGVSFSHAIVKITNKTLNELANDIAEINNYKHVVIMGLKDLTEKEYNMLKDDKENSTS